MVTATDLVAPPRATTVSQVTAVEQARAVAEVLAAVQVAQQCPRDIRRAQTDMEAATGRLALANRAFYSVPNRGSGPSVHLARELARIWGNIDYGVRELRRDDAAGESEVQAFAWDQQTNARSTRSFIVPHMRMKKVKGEQTREKLLDLGDIYLNNQNIGARAVRECIYAILPGDLVAEAEDRCRATLERGDGKSLPDRITDMIGAFKTRHGVTEAQISARLQRPSGQWTAQDVAALAVVYRSIERSETSISDEFPAVAVTAADLTGPTPEPPAPPAVPAVEPTSAPPAPPVEEQPQAVTPTQLKRLGTLMTEAGIVDRASRLSWVSDVVGREVGSSKELNRVEAARVMEAVEAFIAERREAAAEINAEGEQPELEP